MSDAIDASLRDASVVMKGDYRYVIHPLTDGVPRAQPALLREFATWCKETGALQDVDLLVAPEAMALPLAAAVSLATDIPYVVVRKRRYDLPGETKAYSETGYGHSSLYINDVKAGDRVVVIEDVLSTGGTATGLLTTLQSMQVDVRALLVFLDKGERAKPLQKQFGLPIHAMRRVRVDDGGVHPIDTP